ncbi:hypothetical protein AAMO2058_000495100 [Amorphochlora amoebiformis]
MDKGGTPEVPTADKKPNGSTVAPKKPEEKAPTDVNLQKKAVKPGLPPLTDKNSLPPRPQAPPLLPSPPPAVLRGPPAMTALVVQGGPQVLAAHVVTDVKMHTDKLLKREKERLRKQRNRKRKREALRKHDWTIVMENRNPNPRVRILETTLQILPQLKLLRGYSLVPPLFKLDLSSVLIKDKQPMDVRMANIRDLFKGEYKVARMLESKFKDTIRTYVEINTQKIAWMHDLQGAIEDLAGGKPMVFKWSAIKTECTCTSPTATAQPWHYDHGPTDRRSCATLLLNVSESLIATTHFSVGCWTPNAAVRYHPGQGLLFSGYLHSCDIIKPRCEAPKGSKCGRAMYKLYAAIAFDEQVLKDSSPYS